MGDLLDVEIITNGAFRLHQGVLIKVQDRRRFFSFEMIPFRGNLGNFNDHVSIPIRETCEKRSYFLRSLAAKACWTGFATKLLTSPPNCATSRTVLELT